LRAKGILDAAAEFLEWLEVPESRRVIERLLRSGSCMLLVDGLDETSEEHQRSVIREVLDLRAKYDESLICISSRPFSLSIGLVGFTKWETLPLSSEDRRAFVEKWFDSVDSEKGGRLLEQCKTRPEMLDLGSSPLLLSLVCALYYNDLDVPSDPDELYARSIEGLLGGWDAFRNIARQSILADLSIRRRVILLSWIAAILLENGKLVFSCDDVDQTECLVHAARALRIDPPPSEELLPSLFNDFGILVERSPGLYSFSHLTLHEYLVA